MKSHKTDLAKDLIAMGVVEFVDDLRDKGIDIPTTPLEKAYEAIITNDETTIKQKNWTKNLSGENINVLLVGETGTGKELFAKLLHGNRKGQFVPVNCGGVPDTLLEAEFFGAEKGAYTGCEKTRSGYFEQAINGTIFLDEIGELERPLQSKLLRVIQSRRVRRLGSSAEISLNCRIVSATNISPEILAKDNKVFRTDLYYRLAGTIIELPPLRKRYGDAELIWNKLFPEQPYFGVDEQWPGNIRELLNKIEELKLIRKYSEVSNSN